jgi:hypothetical protein
VDLIERGETGDRDPDGAAAAGAVAPVHRARTRMRVEWVDAFAHARSARATWHGRSRTWPTKLAPQGTYRLVRGVLLQ